MSHEAERDAPVVQDDRSQGRPERLPEHHEKLRLRFELELSALQDAGASLDSLLRAGKPSNGDAPP
jgi:hypothetical protein